jgi:hypothetical protein
VNRLQNICNIDFKNDGIVMKMKHVRIVWAGH